MGAILFRILMGLAGALTDAAQQYLTDASDPGQSVIVGVVTAGAAYGLGKLGRYVDQKYNDALQKELEGK